ncbi:hypothetical protein SVAN01_10348 [Stagonosporopsis vannaccii]|nr:hypothetical protein SVAN01_10348 [Stagonosporopsis vannaccii]
MATEDTVQLSEAHAPHQASIDAFESILETLKEELMKLRHDHDSTGHHLTATYLLTLLGHEPEYFRAVQHIPDSDLASFTAHDLESVRVAISAYGLHLFGKIRITAVDDGYIHVRVFGSPKNGTDGSSTDEREYSLHSIHTEEVVKEDGDRVYRAIFGRHDELECEAAHLDSCTEILRPQKRRSNMETHFQISEAVPADAEAIASLFALSWVSPFTRLQFGQIDPKDLATSMIPRITEQILKVSSRFIVARHVGTSDVAAVAQWTLPVGVDLCALDKESKEEREERRQFEDEAYMRSLPESSNKDLIMAFTLGLRQLREETLQGREHFLLENLATHPDYRGKGLASRLIEWASLPADEQRVLVYLDTASDNPAARLYKKLGFEEQGRNTIKDLTRYASIESIECLGCDMQHTHIAFLRFPNTLRNSAS